MIHPRNVLVVLVLCLAIFTGAVHGLPSAAPSSSPTLPPVAAQEASETPPPAPFGCTKPIESLTMIWDGSNPIRIKAWKGDVGSFLLADIDDIVPGDEVTISNYTGSRNDVDWEIFEAGTNNKSGESTFHVSCSDDKMDGPEDCGKRQGDGKRDDGGYINEWLLEGMVDSQSSFKCTPPETERPTGSPATATTETPTIVPTDVPTGSPTSGPTIVPTEAPTIEPSNSQCVFFVKLRCATEDGLPACNRIGQPSRDRRLKDGECIETLVYEITITNSGDADMEVTKVEFTFNGEMEDLLGSLHDNPLAPRQPTSFEVEKCADEVGKYVAQVDVEANPPNGPECDDRDVYQFGIPPQEETESPTSAPTTSGPTIVPTEAPTIEPSNSQCVFFVKLRCATEDGLPACNRIGQPSRDRRLKDGECIETLVYEITITNSGDADMEVTKVEFTFNGEMEDLLGSLHDNPLAPRQPTSFEVEKCADEVGKYVAQVDVEANPPNGPECDDRDVYQFGIPPQEETESPTSAPTTSGPTIVPTEAPTIEPSNSQCVFFVKLRCATEDGLPACNRIGQPSRDRRLKDGECIETLVYEITITNSGDADMEVTKVEFTFNGEMEDLLGSLHDNPLAPRQPTSFEVEKCADEVGKYVAQVDVEANPPNGPECDDRDVYQFGIPPQEETESPTSAPTTSGPTIVPTEAPTIEPSNSQCVFFVKLRCATEDGLPACNRIGQPSRDRRLKDGECIETLVYEITITNSGDADMEVTKVEFTFNGEMEDLLGSLHDNPLAPRQPTSFEVEKCADEVGKYVAQVDVEANPPNGPECDDRDVYQFGIPPQEETESPTSAPTTSGPTIVPTEAPTIEPSNSQCVFFVKLRCATEDGLPACNRIGQPSRDRRLKDGECIETLVYEITITNSGDADMEVTKVEFTFNGEMEDLLGSLHDNPLAPRQPTSFEVEKCADEVGKYVAQVDVEANPPNGPECDDRDVYQFGIPPQEETESPTSAPTTSGPTIVPTEAPTTAVPTGSPVTAPIGDCSCCDTGGGCNETICGECVQPGEPCSNNGAANKGESSCPIEEPTADPSAIPSGTPSASPTTTPIGSCCVNGHCKDGLTEEECEMVHEAYNATGTYRGDGTTCPTRLTESCDLSSSDGPCPPGQGCVTDACGGPTCTLLCGDTGQPCCQELCSDECTCACGPGHVYNIGSKSCEKCGEEDDLCCSSECGDACNPGFTCLATGRCTACGDEGQPHCDFVMDKPCLAGIPALEDGTCAAQETQEGLDLSTCSLLIFDSGDSEEDSWASCVAKGDVAIFSWVNLSSITTTILPNVYCCDPSSLPTLERTCLTADSLEKCIEEVGPNNGFDQSGYFALFSPDTMQDDQSVLCCGPDEILNGPVVPNSPALVDGDCPCFTTEDLVTSGAVQCGIIDSKEPSFVGKIVLFECELSSDCLVFNEAVAGNDTDIGLRCEFSTYESTVDTSTIDFKVIRSYSINADQEAACRAIIENSPPCPPDSADGRAGTDDNSAKTGNYFSSFTKSFSSTILERLSGKVENNENDSF